MLTFVRGWFAGLRLAGILPIAAGLLFLPPLTCGVVAAERRPTWQRVPASPSTNTAVRSPATNVVVAPPSTNSVPTPPPTNGVLGSPTPGSPVRPPASNSVVPPPGTNGFIRLPATNSVTASPRTNGVARPSATNGPPRLPDTWYVTADKLNLRQGPSAQFAQIGELGRGAVVNRVAETNDVKEGRWFRVRTGTNGAGSEGWVLSEHLARARSLTEGDFANLVYGPIPKRAYPGRPARKVRGLYVSINVVGSHRFPEILALARKTSINALVIDFKDDIGELLTQSSTAARLNPVANQKSRNRDVPKLIRELKAANLYLIARIVTFKDPIYAHEHTTSAILDARTGRPYQSRDGLTWSSPYDAEFRAYNLGLAEEAAAAGFDEVQFDYVRFPDVSHDTRLDFRASSAQTKAQVVQNFLLEARRRLEPRGVYLAADVFGLVCTVVDDMRIGQYWEAISNAVDFICPMMYPSHYANGSYGLDIPDRFPFELADRGVRDAKRRNQNLDTPAAIRPWLQGFTASWVKGHRNYGPAEVRAQIRALERNGIDSFLIWHPGGKYDAAAY
jgi:hypothetical protein